MRHTLLHEREGQRSYALVFDRGDEVVATLEDFARSAELGAARFAGIGAFRDAVLAWFDWDAKDYRRIPVDEQVEVMSLLGNVSREDGAPKVHAHVTVGTATGDARGGHLLEAHVRPTLELFLTEAPARLERRKDEASGLALIRP